LLIPVEAEGFEQLQNHLQYRFRRVARKIDFLGDQNPVKTRSSANRAEVRLCTGLGSAALRVVRIVVLCGTLVF
jgi:hypothetical protein